MKIAFVLVDLYKTGSMVVTHTIAKGLAKNHEIVVYAFELKHKAPADIPIRYVPIPVTGRSGKIRSFRFLFREFAREDFSHIFTVFDLFELIVLAAAKCATLRGSLKPVCVFTIHSSSRFLKHLPVWKRLPIYLIYFLTVHLFDRVVAVSHGLQDDWRRHFFLRKKIFTLYNPVDTDLILRRACENPGFSFRPGIRYLITAGSLEKHKNHILLISALELLLRQRKDLFLIIAGEGREFSRLFNLINERNMQDHVFLAGRLENPWAWIAKADVFVLSSDYEGLSTVLIEALCLGIRIVSTDCLASPSEILDHGRYGRLVPINDPAAMARAISESLDEPAHDADLLRERGRSFSPVNVIPRYEAFLTGNPIP